LSFLGCTTSAHSGLLFSQSSCASLRAHRFQSGAPLASNSCPMRPMMFNPVAVRQDP
jgi:hypothetical protein